MIWSNFIFYAVAALLCWVAAILVAHTTTKRWAAGSLYLAGSLVIGLFIWSLWAALERPPLRTLGETRLWYTFFVTLIGGIIYLRWRFKLILTYSTLLAIVFIGINIAYPDTHSKVLMPALQSPWFVPHVIVYIFSYALLGASSIVAIYLLYRHYRRKSLQNLLYVTDTLVYLGLSFLTMGMIFGAFWAKEAWGHYWTWDPKETWAFITWLGYLLYVHFRHHHPQRITTAAWMLSLAFVVLLICWFGVNYLPAAQTSVHTYTM